MRRGDDGIVSIFFVSVFALGDEDEDDFGEI
jgi:hypothetical protein